jgi:hypothetical protein
MIAQMIAQIRAAARCMQSIFLQYIFSAVHFFCPPCMCVKISRLDAVKEETGITETGGSYLGIQLAHMFYVSKSDTSTLATS